MAKTISPEHLPAAIAGELERYCSAVTDGVNRAGDKSMKRLVRMTKATAPVGARGSFRRNITSTRREVGIGAVEYVWHVKPPDHRLVHLLAKGHATRDGGRARAFPFLQDALEVVLPEYEQEVKEVVRRGG